MKVRQYLYFILIFSLLQFCATVAQAQTASGTLHGQVSDPSGAAIPNASVVLTPAAAGSTPIKTQANGQGQYEFKGLAPGQYTLNAFAQGFSVYENDNVVIPANQSLVLNVPMTIEVEQQKIQVEDTAPTVDVNPSNNAGAITITGKELEALPDDPDELLTDCKPWPAPPLVPTAASFILTVSPPASFLQKNQFAKFASIRIRSRLSMTSSVTDVLKCSPSRAPTNFTVSSR